MSISIYYFRVVRDGFRLSTELIAVAGEALKVGQKKFTYAVGYRLFHVHAPDVVSDLRGCGGFLQYVAWNA